MSGEKVDMFWLEKEKALLTHADRERIKVSVTKAARKLCQPEVEGYYKCLKDQSFTAIVNCRNTLKALDDCAAQYTTDKHFHDATITYLVERRHKKLQTLPNDQQQQQQPQQHK